MTEQTLPSGGGAYERKKDGSLIQTEAPTAPAEAVETPVEADVERPAKSKLPPKALNEEA